MTRLACGGVFQAAPNLPADPVTGRRVCLCGLVGKAGDGHHPVQEVPDMQRIAAGDDTEGGER